MQKKNFKSNFWDSMQMNMIQKSFWWVKNNMGSSFHVNDNLNERYIFIAHIDDEK